MNYWPKKHSREVNEIKEFMLNYSRLKHGRNFRILERRESPDYTLIDIETDELFCVELTSVYLSDRSVPDNHINGVNNWINYSEEEIIKYLERIKNQIIVKIQKSKNYDLRDPLILSIYVNEYISIHIERRNWENFEKSNENLFDNMSPICEIVFWPLVNNEVFSIR